MTPRQDADLERAQQLVSEALSRVEELSHTEAGRAIGVSESTVRRWREGDVSVLRSPVRESVEAFVFRYNDPGELLYGSPVVSDTTVPYGDEVAAEAVILDPNLARRLLGSVAPEHKRTRLAIIHEFEGAFVEAGKAIPQWLTALRTEVLSG